MKVLPPCPFCAAEMIERSCYGWLTHYRCPRWHAVETCYEMTGETPTGVDCRGCVPLEKTKHTCPVCQGGVQVCSVDAGHVVCSSCHVCWASAPNAPVLERCESCGGTGLRPPAKLSAA